MNYEKKEISLEKQDVTYWLDRIQRDPANLDSKLFWSEIIRNYFIANFLRTNMKDELLDILDVPSGSSPIAEFLIACELKFRYFGIEADITRADKTKSRLKELEAVNREFSIVNDYWNKQKLFSPSSFYDVVLCLEGPEHLVSNLDRLSMLFQDFAGTMTNESFLIVSTPRATDTGELRYPYCHNVEFSFDEIKETLEENFEILQMHGYRLQYSRKDEALLDELNLFCNSMPWPLKAIYKCWDRPTLADSIVWVARLKL